MKKTLLTIGVSIVALAFALPVFAQQQQPAPKGTKVIRRDFAGDIKSIDTGSHSLTVTSKDGSTKTFTLAAKARIITTDKGASAKLTDLKVGDSVTVSYMPGSEGVYSALTIAAQTVPKKPTGTAASSTNAPARAPVSNH